MAHNNQSSMRVIRVSPRSVLIEVNDFDVSNKHELRSPWFEMWDLKWRLKISVGTETEEDLGLYLQMDTYHYPSQAANFVLEMINRTNETKSIKEVADQTTFEGDDGWGFFEFVKLPVLKSESGFLVEKNLLLSIAIDLVGKTPVSELKMLQNEMKQWDEEKKASEVSKMANEVQKQALEKARQKLSMETEAWEKSAKKLQAFQPGKAIKLNVGGTMFQTSLTTLTSHPSSFFGAMMSGRWDLQLQEDGSIFIDRGALVFLHVLSFMRGETILFKCLSEAELNTLLADARFYQLAELEAQIPL